MRLTEIWTGTKSEQKAIQRGESLQGRGKLSRDENQVILGAKGAQRRILLRRLGIQAAALVVLAAGGILYATQRKTADQESERTDEEAYNFYVQSLEMLARNDQQASEILRFFKERRKRAIVKGETFYADEEGESKINFYTVIVDPKRHLQADRELKGFAEYRTRESPTVLILRNHKMTSVWAGALLANEALLVYRYLNGIENNSRFSQIESDQEAYDLEFRLLNKATDGKLQEVFTDLSQSIPPGNFKTQLSEAERLELSALFPPALSEFETDLRETDLLIGLNFRIAETRLGTELETKQWKIDYLNFLYDRQGQSGT